MNNTKLIAKNRLSKYNLKGLTREQKERILTVPEPVKTFHISHMISTYRMDNCRSLKIPLTTVASEIQDRLTELGLT